MGGEEQRERETSLFTPRPLQNWLPYLATFSVCGGFYLAFFFLLSHNFMEVHHVVDGNLDTTQKVIDVAITQISQLRGRFGAFQKNIIQSTIRALSITLENTTAAESIIRDTNFASETADLTRAQILVNAGTNILAIANAQPQSALALLG